MTDQSNPDSASFYELGLQGLYGGLTLNEICARKGLQQPDQNIFERVGITERAAFFFLVTQAEAKIHREGLQGDQAKKAYQEVGEEIRYVIKAIGNPMPENLPILEDV